MFVDPEGWYIMESKNMHKDTQDIKKYEKYSIAKYLYSANSGQLLS